MNPGIALAWTLGAYLLGAISFAFLIVRLKAGVDLRSVGSGNLGATNAARVLGFKFAVIVYLLDFLKGFGPVMIAIHPLGDPGITTLAGFPLSIAMGAAAFAGHCFPPYLGFRGGKGVATASGVVVGLAPLTALIAMMTFGIVVAIFRMISLGSMVAAITLPVAYLSLKRHGATITPGLFVLSFFLVLAVMVVVRHRANIQRIVEGNESRIGAKRT